jgi:hypothetical protein
MQASLKLETVQTLLDLRSNHMLSANPEYQRGVVWDESQKKRLIDSVLRGYPLPLFYLHHISKMVGEFSRNDFEVIDGQQRLNALSEFREGAFPLFDPVLDEKKARFPSFISENDCPWGRKRFEDLSDDLKSKFLQTTLSVVYITTDQVNEARDLFIRLQGGMPLTPQEKRDAWPGNFTEYILRIGGKTGIARYPGNDFFRHVMKEATKKRGEARNVAAQMAAVYLSRRRNGSYSDVNSAAIDSCYHENLNFDLKGEEAKRFVQILDILAELLRDGKRSRVLGHEAISLLLLVDSMIDDYSPSWRDHLASAFDNFRAKLAVATKDRYDAPSDYWNKYGQLARTSSDQGETIERRHRFFVQEMLPLLQAKTKDPVRIFGPLEREIIYARDRGICQSPTCGGSLKWSDMEIHHIDQHSEGGKTDVANGASVHKDCHPKSAAAVAAFREAWSAKTDKSTLGI